MIRKILLKPQNLKKLRCSYCTKNTSLPELTKNRYPEIQRNNFALLNNSHLEHFTKILGASRILTETSDCQSYNVDWIKNVRGYSRCVLKPKNTEEVSAILSYCNEQKLAVCTQGGNTGLVGGSVPVFDEIVLSTELMNQVISIDEISGVLVCQSGCILQNLDQALEEKNLMVPLDLGAKGTCHIGGNVATNAGGLRLLRYGNLHGTILGLEAVKANGDVIDCLSTLKKDNTGYHLKHLFIGSEGTLGVVTKVAIQCPTKPKSYNLAFLGVSAFDKVLLIFRRSKLELGEILASFELIDAKSLEVVTSNLKLTSPIGDYPFYVLIETHGSSGEHDEEKLNAFLSKAMDDQLVLDGTVTNEVTKMKKIWELRERITEGLSQDGYVFKYDLSIPIKEFYNIVEVLRSKVGDDALRICGYGHIGDSNIHLNVTIKEYSKEIHKKIEPFVYEFTSKLKGSISAEHGIGFRKPKYIHYSKSPAAINLMKGIKTMMDPCGILNPYKVLP